jgi:glycosyltransferase involved in cell wall biosynthesis
MPCLNEAETVVACVEKAHGFLARTGALGEVIVADNGSTDGSQALATAAGARVVAVSAKGYGSALRGGITAARGTYVIMGDADDSYDFSNLDGFLSELRGGAELVMGNRFRGGIARGAMPVLHKYLGNPVLSWIGRLFFGISIGDFHCGLRGFNRKAILGLGLRTTGMEFASEVVVRASAAGLSIVEVPTTLAVDGRSRPPHLRTWQDGWRHLRFLLLYSPRWLFLYPGLALAVVSFGVVVALMISPITIGDVTFSASTLVVASMTLSLGYQSVSFAMLGASYGHRIGLLPPGRTSRITARLFTVDRGVTAGILVFLVGVCILGIEVANWAGAGFGRLNADTTIRRAVPGALFVMLGFQTILFSMFDGILQTPTAPPDEV